MAKSPNVFAGVVPKKREAAPEEPEARERGDQRGMIRQTFYLPPAVHDQFRDLAHAKRVTQQELFRRAANLLFEQEGLPTYGELWGRKK